ncbi:MAG TPA: ATP-binding protein [Opitutaceae bacterium]|nr:ATP-binding protein [Opitutaceae bacterium]
MCGILLLWLLSAPERTHVHRCLGVFFLTSLDCAAAWAFIRAARRADLPAGFRKGLRWISSGLALCGLGSLYLLLLMLLHPETRAIFNLSDLLFLASYPAVLAGLLCMPRVDRPSIGLGRLLVDIAVFAAGVGLPLWFFAVEPGLSTASGYDAAMDVAWPVVTFGGIAALNIVLLTRMPLPSRRAFRLLAIAIGISWLADLLFLLDSIHGFVQRSPINWINVFNTLSIGLYLLAAGRMESDKLARPQAVRPAASSPLPIITIVAVSAWLLMFIIQGHPAPDVLSRIFWSLALLFVVLAVREIYVYRDSSRWLAAEIERESRARFESLVRHSSDVIMVVDAQRTIRFASPAVAGALGTSADAIAGRPLLGLAHPEDAARGAEFLDRLLGAPRALRTVQWRLRHADGSYRHFETVGSNAEGESAVEGLVINSRDVTERVALEDKLRQSQKLEALGQLVGGIAHNFNNILTSTMMRLGFLRENRQLPPEIASQILALDAEARRSADLTKKLVLFGQQQLLRKEPVNLRESVARLQREIARLLGEGIELRIAGGSSPEWVEADAALIEQVIMNLCANARDAMVNGGSLTIEVVGIEATRAAPASDGGTRKEPFVRLSFRDSGCGMDESVKRRLFEPFFTTKGIGGGVGLGLASAHGIVRQHGGWMEVESVLGLGSTFRVYLPRAPEPHAPKAA